MECLEYLASFGLTGEFGRFRSALPIGLRRGERVVVRSPRGIEVAEVLRAAAPGHAHYLPNTTVGQLLRRFTISDEETEDQLHVRSHRLFERGQQLVQELNLPLALVDVEILLDGEHAGIHYLGGVAFDPRPLVSALSTEFSLYVSLVNLALPRAVEESGCERPDCGGGDCGSCGSGGCDSCGAHEHFAQLRDQMDSRRTALL